MHQHVAALIELCLTSGVILRQQWLWHIYCLCIFTILFFSFYFTVVGGLISAHLLSQRGGLDLEPGWPCSGPFLRMAENVARRLLPGIDCKLLVVFG